MDKEQIKTVINDSKWSYKLARFTQLSDELFLGYIKFFKNFLNEKKEKEENTDLLGRMPELIFVTSLRSILQCLYSSTESEKKILIYNLKIELDRFINEQIDLEEFNRYKENISEAEEALYEAAKKERNKWIKNK